MLSGTEINKYINFNFLVSKPGQTSSSVDEVESIQAKLCEMSDLCENDECSDSIKDLFKKKF